jgi:DHA2 family multidrug resistance protein-like MFS transporter
VPAVGVLIVATWYVLPPGATSQHGRFDARGAALLAVTLAGFAWGLSQIDTERGWPSLASLSVWPFLLGGLAGGLVLWHVEQHAEDPVLHPRLFSSVQLRLIGCIAVAAGFVEAGMVFLPGMAVAGLGVAPPTASLMLLPLVAMLVIGAPTAGYLLDKVGAKPVIQIGLGCTILGLIGFGTLPQSTLSFYATGSLIGLGLSSLLGCVTWPCRRQARASAV